MMVTCAVSSCSYTRHQLADLCSSRIACRTGSAAAAAAGTSCAARMQQTSFRPHGSLHASVTPIRQCHCALSTRSRRALRPQAVLNTHECAAPGDQQQQLDVYTKEGTVHKLNITPGSTTVGDIRSAVAEKTGIDTAEVRLAYVGVELDPAADQQVFVVKPGMQVMHSMPRSAGSTAAAPGLALPPIQPVQYELLVYTMNGKIHKLPVTPGKTTGGNIRSAVADRTRAAASQVRLVYAGQELDPGHDSQPFVLNPKIQAMHTMERMQGGGGGGWIGHAADSRGSGGSSGIGWGLASGSGLRGIVAAAAAGGQQVARTAPGAGVRSLKYGTEVSLAKQFRDLMKHPIPGISAAPDDDDPLKWHIRLAGPDNSPYAGGWFNVELKFRHTFPGSMPRARFITPIWHPNITSDGNTACVDLGGDVRSVVCVLSGLKLLLAHPNPSSPVNHGCAFEMQESPAAYESKARAMTVQHAMK